jgi:ketosteroid isomerase-like protein
MTPQAGPIAPDPRTRSEIAQLVATYHEGIHHGDLDRLARVFHPDARLFGEVKGAPYRKSLAEYLAIVRGRVAPVAAGHSLRGELLSLDVRGGVALAVVFTPVGESEYIDLLALIRTDDGWRIASKLFTDAG